MCEAETDKPLGKMNTDDGALPSFGQEVLLSKSIIVIVCGTLDAIKSSQAYNLAQRFVGTVAAVLAFGVERAHGRLICGFQRAMPMTSVRRRLPRACSATNVRRTVRSDERNTSSTRKSNKGGRASTSK